VRRELEVFLKVHLRVGRWVALVHLHTGREDRLPDGERLCGKHHRGVV